MIKKIYILYKLFVYVKLHNIVSPEVGIVRYSHSLDSMLFFRQ